MACPANSDVYVALVSYYRDSQETTGQNTYLINILIALVAVLKTGRFQG